MAKLVSYDLYRFGNPADAQDNQAALFQTAAKEN
jgi:hypothetical protein